MPLIDDHGRLFGRVNLIDAALLIFVLALVPIALVSSRVFREHTPRIDAVVPASQPAGAGRRIRLRGADFRPYLRLFVSPTGQPFSLQDRKIERTEGVFLLESPSEVEVALPLLPPGTYDIHLFDEAREILARPSAIVLEAPAVAALRATVRFVALADVAALIHAGDTDLAQAASAGAVIEEVVSAAASVSAVDALPAGGGRTIAVAAPARAVDVRLAIPATKNPQGLWVYRDQPIRPGDVFNFETVRYAVRGVVTTVSAAAAGAPPDPRGAQR